MKTNVFCCFCSILGTNSLSVILILILTVISCQPSSRISHKIGHINSLILDVCDIELITELENYTKTLKKTDVEFQQEFLNELTVDCDCNYLQQKILGSIYEDSIAFLFTIKSYQLKKDSMLIGKLYNIDYSNDTMIEVICRSAEYSQFDRFESKPMIVSSIQIYDDSVSTKMGR